MIFDKPKKIITPEEKTAQIAEAEKHLRHLESFAQSVQLQITQRRNHRTVEESFAIDLNKKLLHEIKTSIETGPWEQGLLFQNIKKKLQDIYDKYQAQYLSSVEAATHLSGVVQEAAKEITVPEGYVELFVSIYNSAGENILAWEKIIKNLVNQFVPRPIYRSEDAIRTLIRSKINKSNEGYIAVWVGETKLIEIPGGKALQDKFGNQLFLIKDRSINAENIKRFMHGSGRYKYKDKKLIREGDVGFKDLT